MSDKDLDQFEPLHPTGFTVTADPMDVVAAVTPEDLESISVVGSNGVHANGANANSENAPEIQFEQPMLHQAALAAMADEVTRLAREFRRRVNNQELLPILSTGSALGQILEILNQQFATRLWAEGAAPPATREPAGSHEFGEETTVIPGYL